MQDIRNKLVHGWLNKTHKNEFTIKYFNGEKIVVEKINREDYLDIIKIPMFGVKDGNIIFQKSLDETLSEFSDKFINLDLDYWKIINWLNSDGVMDEIYRQIYSDIGLDWSPGLNLMPDLK